MGGGGGCCDLHERESGSLGLDDGGGSDGAGLGGGMQQHRLSFRGAHWLAGGWRGLVLRFGELLKRRISLKDGRARAQKGEGEPRLCRRSLGRGWSVGGCNDRDHLGWCWAGNCLSIGGGVPNRLGLLDTLSSNETVPSDRSEHLSEE